MQIRYVGPHKAVDVPLPSNRWARAERNGEPIEVDDDQGKALLEQKENWAEVKVEKKPEPKVEKKGGES